MHSESIALVLMRAYLILLAICGGAILSSSASADIPLPAPPTRAAKAKTAGQAHHSSDKVKMRRVATTTVHSAKSASSQSDVLEREIDVLRGSWSASWDDNNYTYKGPVVDKDCRAKGSMSGTLYFERYDPSQGAIVGTKKMTAHLTIDPDAAECKDIGINVDDDAQSGFSPWAQRTLITKFTITRLKDRYMPLKMVDTSCESPQEGMCPPSKLFPRTGTTDGRFIIIDDKTIDYIRNDYVTTRFKKDQ